MSQYGVLRVEKYTRGSVRGLQVHDLRSATSSRTNGDIDWNKSHKNYDLCSRQCRNFEKAVESRLEKVARKTRGNSVVMCQALATASHEFFDGKSEEEIRAFFEKCYKEIADEFGEENIVSAVVHLDEKTPHMHLNFVPLTKDNRLSAKELLTPKTLTALQDRMHRKVFAEYGLKRGEKKDEIKHISTLNYKVLTLEREIQDKESQLARLTNEQLFKMQKHIDELTYRLKEMMDVIQSDKELMQEYLTARDKYYQRTERSEDYER